MQVNDKPNDSINIQFSQGNSPKTPPNETTEKTDKIANEILPNQQTEATNPNILKRFLKWLCRIPTGFIAFIVAIFRMQIGNPPAQAPLSIDTQLKRKLLLTAPRSDEPSSPDSSPEISKSSKSEHLESASLSESESDCKLKDEINELFSNQGKLLITKLESLIPYYQNATKELFKEEAACDRLVSLTILHNEISYSLNEATAAVEQYPTQAPELVGQMTQFQKDLQNCHDVLEFAVKKNEGLILATLDISYRQLDGLMKLDRKEQATKKNAKKPDGLAEEEVKETVDNQNKKSLFKDNLPNDSEQRIAARSYAKTLLRCLNCLQEFPSLRAPDTKENVPPASPRGIVKKNRSQVEGWVKELSVSGSNSVHDLVKSFPNRDKGGFHNLTNSCYINAGIQALRAGGFLETLLNEEQEKKEEDEKVQIDVVGQNNNEHSGKIRKALKAVTHAVEGNKEKELIDAQYWFRFQLFESRVNPDMVYEQNDKTSYLRQHDSGAFVNTLLDTLGYGIPTQTIRTLTKEVEVPIKMKVVHQRAAGPQNKEPTLSLALPPLQPNVGTVEFQQAFNNHFAISIPEKGTIRPETIRKDGQDITFTDYTSKLRLQGEPPKYMAFQLKRYAPVDEQFAADYLTPTMARLTADLGSDDPTMIQEMAEAELGIHQGMRKISNPVTLPADETFDAALGFESSKPVKYRAVAAVMHHGLTPGGGHYTAYARDKGTNQWRHYDDNKVTEVTKEEARRKLSEGYCLFFEKVE